MEVSKLHLEHCHVLDTDDEEEPVNLATSSTHLVEVVVDAWACCDLAPIIRILSGAGLKLAQPLQSLDFAK